ncbi:MAG: DUF1080 domain-containing protein [Lentisphaeraceae bacterium]|nr:DUF1080 domain-containing protein [Lentisphaeraceae bacterium]
MKQFAMIVIAAFFLVACQSNNPDNWESIFNGKSLQGWKVYCGQHDYRVEDGILVGTAKLNEDNGFLTYEKKYQDFELEFEVLCDDKLNSGCQIRSALGRKDHLAGPQVEIEERTGGYIYGEFLFNKDGSRRGWMSDRKGGTPQQNQARRAAFKANKWNTYKIRAKGNHYQTWVNGVLIADLKDDVTNKAGYIGLQVHSIKNKEHEGVQVRWRNIRIRDLH